MNEIRRLGTTDLNIFKKLLALFAVAFEGQDSIEGTIPDNEYLTSLLKRVDFYALAAIQGEEVLGGLTGYEFPLAAKNEREMYLYDLAVDENHRKKGIATALIEALKVIAKENNIALIFVEAESKDVNAISFYESLGEESVPVTHFNIAIE